VGPLDADASLGLALELLDACDPEAWTLGKAIAREARGNPLFIAELSAYLAMLSDRDEAEARTAVHATLDQALTARVGLLGPGEQDFLTILAVAGAPIEQSVAARVSRLAEDPRLTVGSLTKQRLVHPLRHAGHEAVELAHEPLREVLLARLDAAAARELHRRLARELEAGGRTKPATLARHFAEAGDRTAAAEHSMRAGELAAAALAFARAAHFYENALVLGSAEDPERWRLLAALAEALARAGQPGEAVTHLLEATRLAPTLESIKLTRRATELQLQESRVDGLLQGSSPQRYTLFDEIEREQVQSLLAESDIVEGRKGELLLAPTKEADSFYFVLSGSVEVRRNRGSGARVPEGAVLGEVPFLLQAERVADVIAAEDETRLLALNQRSLEALTESNPRLALQLVLNLSRVVCSKLVSVQKRVFATLR
jgi:tetratricopeptide (TPR) repeat protein